MLVQCVRVVQLNCVRVKVQCMAYHKVGVCCRAVIPKPVPGGTPICTFWVSPLSDQYISCPGVSTKELMG